MAQQYATTFLIPASDTTPIVLTGFGHAPEVLMTFWNGRIEVIDTVGRADSRRGLGFAIGSGALDQSSVSHLLADNVPASDTLSGVFNDTIVSLVGAAGVGSPPFSDGSARLASIDEDGITLDITTPFSVPTIVRLLSLGPELVTDKAIGLAIPFPAVTGDQVITGLGFQPTAAIFASTGRAPDEPSYSQYCWGFSADDGAGGVDQSLLVGYSRGNGQSSDARRYCRRDYCLGLSIETPGNDALERRASLSSFDPDGFTLDHDTINPATKVFGYLALDGPGFRAGGFTVGQEAVTGLPFVPRSGIFHSAGQIESPDSLAMQRDDISIGGVAAIDDDGIEQSSGATRSEDAQTTQTVSTRITYDAIAGGISQAAEADGDTRLGPMRNDGFDIQTPDPWEGGDVYVGYLTFGAPQPAITDSRLAVVPAGSLKPPVEDFNKDPGSTLDYGLNWDAPLSDENAVVQDSVTKSTWSVVASITGIEIEESPPPSFNGNETRVWLSGGVDGENYDVVNRIETLNGRVYERTIQIKVRER